MNTKNITVGCKVRWNNDTEEYPVTKVGPTRFSVAYVGSEYDYPLDAPVTVVSRLTVSKPARKMLPETPAANTQNAALLKHLKRTGSITPREALIDHSIQSTTKRMSELRRMGHDIKSVWKNHPITGQRYVRYEYTAA